MMQSEFDLKPRSGGRIKPGAVSAPGDFYEPHSGRPNHNSTKTKLCVFAPWRLCVSSFSHA